jgi:cell fate regulator YaaT (PSP1 superfamily)
MPNVTGIRFRQAGRVYHFATEGFTNLQVGDWVIVETARGIEAGRVAIPPREVANEDLAAPLKAILRRATAWDMTQMEFYRQQEAQILTQCRQKVAESPLSMKVIRAEYNFDGSYITFYFTSEKRVDFRDLVRELANTFKTRIELRQVGVRDEVKLMEGLGCCGLVACCASHLTEFTPISIKMAKQQDLPLSPMEISGVCGRLLCCLSYENDYYVQTKAGLPQPGDKVRTNFGAGTVTGVNVIKEALLVALENGANIEVLAHELVKPEQAAVRRGRRRKKD